MCIIDWGPNSKWLPTSFCLTCLYSYTILFSTVLLLLFSERHATHNPTPPHPKECNEIYSKIQIVWKTWQKWSGYNSYLMYTSTRIQCYSIERAIPNVMRGHNHSILQDSKIPILLVPFKSELGNFWIQICVKAI